MEKWFVPLQMSSLAGQTVKKYGYDSRGQVEYSFNSLGFRAPEETHGSRLVVVGNSVSFGIGLDIEHTFGSMLAKSMNRSLDNRALGCIYHENHDNLVNLHLLAAQQHDSVFVIQINNLDRRREGNSVLTNNSAEWCVDRFLDFFDQTEEILKYYPHKYIYWDDINYSIPDSVLKKIVINNKFHLDNSLPNNNNTFGIRTHSVIAKILRHVI